MNATFPPGPYDVWSSLYEGFKASVVIKDSNPLRTLAEVRDFKAAQLFGAAPEMHDALCRVRHWIDTSVPIGTEAATTMLGIVLDALAKTEGLRGAAALLAEEQRRCAESGTPGPSDQGEGHSAVRSGKED